EFRRVLFRSALILREKTSSPRQWPSSARESEPALEVNLQVTGIVGEATRTFTEPFPAHCPSSESRKSASSASAAASPPRKQPRMMPRRMMSKCPPSVPVSMPNLVEANAEGKSRFLHEKPLAHAIGAATDC